MEDLVVTRQINPDPSFWSGRRVLLTGHTGFKGAWLALWLRKLGAQVSGAALAPSTNPNLAELAGIGELIEDHRVDIRDPDKIAQLIRAASPEVVFHLAAQAFVLTSYREPLQTFATNIQGTVNVLEAVRGTPSVRTVIAVTTDKVYSNLEHVYPYRETDALGGYDPYSASKAAAEIVIASYRNAFLAAGGIAVASARAGNVIGGGDWSEDRLIPDAVRAWSISRPLVIRRPDAIRPWQHVLEPLAAYLRLAERLWVRPDLAGAYNFGPDPSERSSVRDVVELARRAYGRGEVSWGQVEQGPHEAGWLALETAKARHVLDIAPRWALGEAVERTLNWYRSQRDGQGAHDLCLHDIADFESDAAREPPA